VPVSEEGILSNARVNSKSVRGATKGAQVTAGAACAGDVDVTGVDVDTGVGSFGGSATVGAGTSRVLNTVSLPDMRKIPPPTCPADFASRTCLASLNDAGVGFGEAEAGAGEGAIGVDFPSEGGDWETRRELMGFKRISLSVLVGWVMTGG